MNNSKRFTLSQLMKQAWLMVKKYGMKMSDAMKQAWKVASLRKAMKKGVVRFTYKKVTGEIRTALGTLNFPFKVNYDKSSDVSKCYSSVPYMDVEKNAWRSFNIANLINVIA